MLRRIALFSALLALVISLTAPTGAVFASEGALESEAAEVKSQTGKEEAETSEQAALMVSDVPSLAASDTPLSLDEAAEGDEPSPDPPIVVPPEEVLPASPLLVTAYKATGAHMHAVQIYNNSSGMVPLGDVTLLYVAGGNEYAIPLVSGWIEPRSYVVVAWQGESEYADIEFMFDPIGGGALELIELRHSGYQLLSVDVPAGYDGELLHRYKSSAGNYTTNATFATGAEAISGGGLYMLPGAPDLSVREILVKPRPCVVSVETPDCYDYIKVRNDGAEPLDLSGYRLRSGFSNTSSTASNTTYFDDVLLPGEVRTLTHDRDGKRVSFAANDGTVWLEDRYGFEAYDLEVSPYVGANLAAQTGRSWAYNDTTEQWQWATPAPFEIENDFTVKEPGKGAGESQGRQLVPCKEGQYRSEETNRCRNIASSSTLKPCREGQYRSEETNRCRSIASAAASILKPCADGQFRNPATNRCKSIASTDDIALADCGEGRERNPATNRCRNVVSSILGDTVPFPVEEIGQSEESFVGWWVLGIVAAAGVGYGVWEWRHELMGYANRTVQFLSRSK